MAALKIPRILIAGTHSGVGKTTVSMALALALDRIGFSVQPFKVGPDYLDPGYLGRAAGRSCRNLDAWLMPKRSLPGLLARASTGAQGALIEGVMGLYDGRDAVSEAGSTAEMAKQLQCPVLLVVDVSAVSRSAAAVVKGFRQMDRAVDIAGCVVNRVGSPGHYRLVREGIERLTGVPVVGWLAREASLKIPERHLGLVPWQEQNRWRTLRGRLEQRAREGFDLPAIVRIMQSAPRLRPQPLGRILSDTVRPSACGVPIAVARDEAFHFYYPENLELLEQCGARIHPFSPLRDKSLPRGIGGLYLGGGFPEIHAAALARNRAMRESIRRAVVAGLPTYAECGGLMFLARSIRDGRGRKHPMVGLLPGDIRMTPRLQNFGYQAVRARKDTLLARRGETARGHEFHHSILSGASAWSTAAYTVVSAAGKNRRCEGYSHGNLLASYVHVHFGSQPRWAERFVQAARSYVNRQADVMLGSLFKSGAAPQL